MASRVIPFPFPFRVGTDLCDINRIYKVLSGPYRQRFVRRILSKDEITNSRINFAPILDPERAVAQAAQISRGNTVKNQNPHQEIVTLQQLRDTAKFLAGRFAAKEAAIKAHPHRRLTWHDIAIQNIRAQVSGKQTSAEEHSTGGSTKQQTAEEPAEAEPEKASRFRGAPVALIKGDPDEGLADQEALISISHDGNYATAVCIGFDPSRSGAGRSIDNGMWESASREPRRPPAPGFY